jgi:hypothetical protein
MILRLFRVSKRENCNRHYVWQRWGFGLFIHEIHTSEDRNVFHNHPWSGISLILGSYVEQYHGTRPVRRWLINWIKAERHHRIEVNRTVYTIFFHFRRKNNHSWTVIDTDGNVLKREPWRGIGGDPSYSSPSSTLSSMP